MEKYRRFTDEKTGINPFIKAIKSQKNFILTLIKPFIFLLKSSILLTLLLLRTLLMFPEAILPNPVYKLYNSKVNSYFCSFVFFLAGLIQKDDHIVTRYFCNNSKPKLILVNSSCSLDGFICLFYLSPVEFAIKHKNKNIYTHASPMSLILRFFSSVGFISQNIQGTSLKQLYQNSVQKGRNLVVFFEGVRTTGDGVLQSEQVVEDLVALQSAVTLLLLQYKISNPSVQSVVSSSFSNFYNMLTTKRIFLKAKVKQIPQSSLNLVSEATSAVYDFYQVNGLKKISRNSEDYFQFLQFYRQEQRK